MSRFQTTFKTETETQYTLSPSNKFGIHFDKVNKIATVEITVFDRTAPAGQRVQTFATKKFESVKAAKNFCWDNEYVPAKDLITDGKLISSF